MKTQVTIEEAIVDLTHYSEFYGWDADMLDELEDDEIINELGAWFFVLNAFEITGTELLKLVRAELLKGVEA